VLTQLRSRLIAGSRLTLVGVTVIALLGAATASASTDKKKPKKKPKPAAVGAVYTQTNDPAANSVVVFNRYANGTLKKRQAVSTGGKGSTQSVGCGPGCPILDSQNAVVVSKNGKFVFAVNAGSNTVTSFRETTSGLKQVSQVSSGGTTPESLALNGAVLYVLNVATANANGTTGNIYGLRISADGHLSALGSSQPLANAAPPDRSADPRAIDIDPTGKVIVVTELVGGLLKGGPPGAIDTFVVGSDGKAGPAVAHPSSDVFPFGFAFDNKGHLIVSNLHNPMDPTAIGSVSTYNVTAAGDVTPIDTKSSSGILPCWVAVTNDGRYTYVVNTGAGHPAPVNGFGLSASGALSPLSPATDSQPGEFARTDEAFSRDSKFLYVLSPQVGPGNPSHIDEYRVGANGSLTLIGSTPAGANLGIGATGLAAR
jgi:6-phosphogluconolactonase (cycloisomerase 2 family)